MQLQATSRGKKNFEGSKFGHKIKINPEKSDLGVGRRKSGWWNSSSTSSKVPTKSTFVIFSSEKMPEIFVSSNAKNKIVAYALFLLCAIDEKKKNVSKFFLRFYSKINPFFWWRAKSETLVFLIILFRPTKTSFKKKFLQILQKEISHKKKVENPLTIYQWRCVLFLKTYILK